MHGEVKMHICDVKGNAAALTAEMSITTQRSTFLQSFLFCCLCFLGVAATAFLVLNNKFILQIYRFPGAAGWLTVLHTVSTGATIRLTKCSGLDVKGTSWS